MTESQIHCFLTVAKEKSISKASEALFVSQPAVSKQIGLLETELGCRLFERHTHGLTLTPAGKSFEKLFLDFQLKFIETIESAKAADNAVRGNYILGSLDGWTLSAFYLDLFSYLSEKYPLVDFEIMGYNIDQVAYALKRGEANSIIATEALFRDNPDITMDHLASVNALLLYSNRHPVAKKPNPKLSDFWDSVFYVTAPAELNSGISNLLLICDNAGFSPRIEHLTSLSSVYNKVQSGRGVFMTNEWIMAKDNPVFKYIELPYKIDIGMASLKGRGTNINTTMRKEILGFFNNSDNE